MSQTEAVKNAVRAVIEETAEQFIMADLSDAAFLESLAGTFARVSADLDAHFPVCAEAARMAGTLLQERTREEAALSDADFASVEQTISAIQTLVEKNISEADLDFPESFGLQAKAAETGEGGENDLASAVDQEIMDEYLAQQEAVVSEIEALVLAYEQAADPQSLTELKRLLHTAKGEAGVIGLNHIEKVCHQVEDYIQAVGTELQADLLLEFKDWFEQTVAALRSEAAAPSPDGLLAALAEYDAADARNPAAQVDTPQPEAGKADSEGEAAAAPIAEPAAQPTAEPAAEPAASGPAASPAETAAARADEAGSGAAGGRYAELLAPVEIEDPEITADFISEANEHFEISDENLLILENDPENEEAIACIFRAFHTIKGTTSFLGLPPISELAHKAENLLDEVRKKHLDFDGAVVDATFNALDLLKTMTRDLENALSAGEHFIPNTEMPAVFEQLKSALAGENGAPAAAGAKAGPGAAKPEEASVSDNGPSADPAAGEETTPDPAPDLEPGASPAPQAPGSSGSSGAAAAADEPKSPAANGGGGGTTVGKSVKQTMKIDADRIDLLLETIGELVIVESIVTQEAALRQGESRELERNLGQLTKITRSLQDMGMSMRLIPIDNTFRKMGRLVRDLAKKSGKKIELVMEGRETELDKSMVEKLGDPLVHMVRNAVDHGIEHTTADREAAGKNPTATIRLKAYHQGGNIHIDIQDDGRGLDREAIAAKAIDRGLISSADNMSDEEIFVLIFEPGFSTAQQITDVSGRGVGMDVVKSNIESMRGNVRIASEKGVGSTFTLVLPLTMAIIDGMILRVGSERYILPLLSIIESFQPTKGMISTVSGKGETVPFRNRLLPLFRLGRLFHISDAQSEPENALVVVVEDAGRMVALMVDELLGQNQTVIKNLGQGLKDVEGIAGASIMADGRPGLIIDVNGLVKMAMG